MLLQVHCHAPLCYRYETGLNVGQEAANILNKAVEQQPISERPPVWGMAWSRVAYGRKPTTVQTGLRKFTMACGRGRILCLFGEKAAVLYIYNVRHYNEDKFNAVDWRERTTQGTRQS